MTATEKQDYKHERLIINETLKWIHPEDAINAAIAWLQCKGYIPEPERARIHALTRKATIPDEQIAEELRQITDRPDVLAFVLDLRDRYEERGKYAPQNAGCQNCARYATDPNSGIRCHECKRPIAVSPNEVFTPDRRPDDPGYVGPVQAIRELEQLATWVRRREYNADDARDEIARSIENRVSILRARQNAPGTIGTGEALPASDTRGQKPQG